MQMRRTSEGGPWGKPKTEKAFIQLPKPKKLCCSNNQYGQWSHIGGKYKIAGWWNVYSVNMASDWLPLGGPSFSLKALKSVLIEAQNLSLSQSVGSQIFFTSLSILHCRLITWITAFRWTVGSYSFESHTLFHESSHRGNPGEGRNVLTRDQKRRSSPLQLQQKQKKLTSPTPHLPAPTKTEKKLTLQLPQKQENSPSSSHKNRKLTFQLPQKKNRFVHTPI